MQNEIEEMGKNIFDYVDSKEQKKVYVLGNGTAKEMREYSHNQGIAEALYDAGYRKEKTCKNITKQHPVDEFICSECGLILQDYCKKRLDEDGDEYFFEFEIKYCPNCGAKVVEE